MKFTLNRFFTKPVTDKCLLNESVTMLCPIHVLQKKMVTK